MSNPTTVVITDEMRSAPVPAVFRPVPRNRAIHLLFKTYCDEHTHDPAVIRNTWKYATKIVDAVFGLARRDWPARLHIHKFDSVPALATPNRCWLTDHGQLPLWYYDAFVCALFPTLRLIADTLLDPKHPVSDLSAVVAEPLQEVFRIQTESWTRLGLRPTGWHCEFQQRMIQNPDRWSLELEKEAGVYANLADACFCILTAIAELGTEREVAVPVGPGLLDFRKEMFDRAKRAKKVMADAEAAGLDPAAALRALREDDDRTDPEDEGARPDGPREERKSNNEADGSVAVGAVEDDKVASESTPKSRRFCFW